MAISDAMAATMHTYLAALRRDSDADLDHSDRQFLFECRFPLPSEWNMRQPR